MPAISVILPTFNRAGSIERTIDSVLAQEFSDWELLVVDDGSTDCTEQVVKRYGDRRIRYLRQDENRGGNAARNRGIREAQADLLAFLDSDDLYLPDRLGGDVRLFDARPEVEMVLAGFLTERERPGEVRPNPRIESNEALCEALFLRRVRKATPGITVRKAAAERVGGFDEGLKRRQDFDFILRLARSGARCIATDAVTWVKTYPDDAMSFDHRGFVPALIAFARRHPAYLANPAYRRGLALDLGRHVARLSKRRMWKPLLSDLNALRAEFGARTLAGLLVQGRHEYRAHRVRRRSDAGS